MVEFDRNADNPIVNQVLGDRYQIQSLLGRKTGRRTFLAIDLATESTVVIKLLLFGPDFAWDDLKLFEREAETLKSLDHPAIPKYLDFFEVETELGKGFALVQNYIEARSLQDWIQSGRTFSEADLKIIAQELLAILDYLHSRQPPVVHRDIKPSNVLLGDRSGNSPGKVYLVDFGSVQTASHDGTVTVVGTYGYMPPEQFGGRALPASDLYSVGATLIYVATGQHPTELPQKDLQIEFQQFTTLSPHLICWFQWLTIPNLSKRPASAQNAIQHLLNPHLPLQVNSSPGSIVLGQRPSAAKISINTTPTLLEINLPGKQIEYFVAGAHPVALWGCLMPIVMTFFLIAVMGVWVILAIVIYLIAYTIYYSHISQDIRLAHLFVSASSPLNAASMTFQQEGSSVVATLNLLQSSKPVVICRKELKSISAGLDSTVPKYRLNLSFQGSGNTIVVRGNRQEIQWLCDELSEWTGFEIQKWEPASA